MEATHQPTRGIFGTIADGFCLYGRNFGRLFLVSILLSILTTIFVFIQVSNPQIQAASQAAANGIATAPVPASHWIAMIINMVVTLWIFGAMYAITGLSNESQKLGAIPALIYAAQRFPALLGAMIIVAIFTAIGGIIFIIPGIVILIFSILSKPLVVIDREGPWSAVKNSFRLVYGSWWYCLGYSIVVMIISAITLLISFAISLITSIIASSIIMKSHPAGTFSTPEGHMMLQHALLPYTLIAFFVCWTFISPLLISFITALFSSVKGRKLAQQK